MKEIQKLSIPQVKKDMLSLKSGIDEAKMSLAKLQGREEELLNQLKKDHNLNSVEEATKKLSTLIDEEASLEASILEKYTTLRSKYEW